VEQDHKEAQGLQDHQVLKELLVLQVAQDLQDHQVLKELLVRLEAQDLQEVMVLRDRREQKVAAVAVELQ
jgi:hypothetical protein